MARRINKRNDNKKKSLSNVKAQPFIAAIQAAATAAQAI